MELNWLEGFQQALRAHEKEKVFEKGEKRGKSKKVAVLNSLRPFTQLV